MRLAAFGANSQMQLGAGYRGVQGGIPVPSVAFPTGGTQPVASYFASWVRYPDGSVLAAGGNDSGALLDGTHHDKEEAPVASFAHGVKALAVAGVHVLALMDDGTVRTGGGNVFGQLGTGVSSEAIREGESTDSPVPVQPEIDEVVQVAAGGGFCAVLRADGTVWAWGENKKGQLGQGNVSPMVAVPVRVPGLEGIIAVACGGLSSSTGHLVALRSDGTVFGCGNGKGGQLGGETDSSTVVEIPGLRGIVAVAAGAGQTFAVDVNGTLWGCGSNVEGQLGFPLSAANVRTPSIVPVLGPVGMVSCGYQFSMVIADGHLYGCGRNDNHQLGLGEGAPATVEGFTPVGYRASYVCSGEHHSLFVTEDMLPAPLMACEPVKGGVRVVWEDEDVSVPWKVAARPFGGSYPKDTLVPPASREYTVQGEGQLEVRLRREGWGPLTVQATAL